MDKEKRNKNIYCTCGYLLFSFVKLPKSTISRKCCGCKKLATYNGDTKEVTTKNLPKRDCSSGKRFY